MRNDTQRWDLLFSRVARPFVADLPDPAAALHLLSRGYLPNTKLSYMSKCRAFFTDCARHSRDPLPATSATMVGYILHELERGALAPPSLAKYL